MLRNLEEGQSYIHTNSGVVKYNRDAVQEAVRISIESGVLSKHTAFVAVEERDEATEGIMKARKMSLDKKGVLHSFL